MRRILAVLSVAVLCVAASCSDGGTKTGNGITARIQAYSTAPAPAVKSTNVRGLAGTAQSAATAGSGMLYAPDAQGTVFTITSVETYLSDLQLKLPEETGCPDYSDFAFYPPLSCNDGKINIEGPFVADMGAGTLFPSPGLLKVPPGTYGEANALLEPGNPVDGIISGGDPLDGITIHGEGTFIYNMNPRTFEFSISFTDKATFYSLTGIPVAGIGIDHLVLAVDTAVWFAALPITDCLDTGELNIDLSDHLVIADSGMMGGSCETIENDLASAIRDSGDLEDD